MATIMMNDRVVSGSVTSVDREWVTIITKNKEVFSIPATSIYYIQWDGEIPWAFEDEQ